MAAKFEIRSPKAGEFNWVLLSQGRTLASGETYTRKVSAEKAIESLRKAAAGATVADLTVRTAPARAAARPAKAAAKPAAAPRKRAAKAATAAVPAKKAAAPRKRATKKA